MRTHLKLVQSSDRAYSLNLNFAEYPIFLPSKSPETDTYAIEKITYEDEQFSQRYELLPGTHGLPNAEDFKILTLFLHLAQEQNSRKLEITSLNRFFGMLKGKSSGHSNHGVLKKRLIEALNRWSGVRCKFTNCFYPDFKKNIMHRQQQVQGILGFSIDDETNYETGSFKVNSIEVTFTDFFWEANKDQHSMLFNLNHTLRMKSSAGQRLYLVLAKNRYAMENKPWSIKLTKLAVKLGMQNMAKINKPSVVKAKIDAAMKEIGPLLGVFYVYERDLILFKLDSDL